jgi:DNA-directed RNA polymerase subunit M/transcription elongation factor TFIIS
MPVETDYTPSHMLCPKCGALMRLVAIESSESVLSADDITYQCGTCNHQEKRVRKIDNT